MKKTLVALAFLCAFCFVLMQIVEPSEMKTTANDGIYLYNPYRNVNFNTAKQYKASLHAHTNVSDGLDSSQTAVNEYARLGYDFIAFTDHDKYRSFQDRGVTDMHGMTGIAGNEFSANMHHTVSLFSNAVRAGITTLPDNTKAEIAQAVSFTGGKGRFILAHPNQTMATLNAPGGAAEFYTAEWYADILLGYKQVLGVEVYNKRGDTGPKGSYPGTAAVWDRLLIETLPTRPVWGFANDDNHGKADGSNNNPNDATLMYYSYGANATFALLEEKTEAAFKKALETGAFFATSFNKTDILALDARGTENLRWDFVPVVTDIVVNTENGSITVSAENCSEIRWITGDVVSSTKIISSGNSQSDFTFNYKDNISRINKYVRPMLIYKESGVTISETVVQPFGIGPYDENSGYFSFDEDGETEITDPWRIAPAPLTITAPVAGKKPSYTIIGAGESFTASLSWLNNPDTFKAGEEYTAVITLEAAAGFNFNGYTDTESIAGFTINGIAPEYLANIGGNKLRFTVTFIAVEKGGGCGGTSPSALTGTLILLALGVTVLFKQKIY